MSVRSGSFSATPLVQRITTGPWPATATLVIVSALFGTWSLTGRVVTFTPELLIPSAIGVPFGIPPLGLFPLGGTTWTFWLVDVVAALVMIAIAWTRLSGDAKRPFLAALAATILAVVVGNLVRIVYVSVETHQSLGAYALTLLLGLAVAALWGLAVGLPVAVVQALDRRSRRTPESAPTRRRPEPALR